MHAKFEQRNGHGKLRNGLGKIMEYHQYVYGKSVGTLLELVVEESCGFGHRVYLYHQGKVSGHKVRVLMQGMIKDLGGIRITKGPAINYNEGVGATSQVSPTKKGDRFFLGHTERGGGGGGGGHKKI